MQKQTFFKLQQLFQLRKPEQLNEGPYFLFCCVISDKSPAIPHTEKYEMRTMCDKYVGVRDNGYHV